MKSTTKYDNMITAFAADFDLAVEDNFELGYLDDKIRENDAKLMTDITLLCELDWLLRRKKAKIVLMEDSE